MAAAGTVTPIDTYRRHQSTGLSGAEDSSSSRRFAISVHESTAVQPNGREVLNATDLYPDLQSSDGRLIQALRLLAESGQYLRSSGRVDPIADFIGYDEQIMRAKESLRRLYALRSIGDGFGAAINAILCALTNKDPEPLTAPQISAVVDVLDKLRKKPKLHFDSSMKLLDQLEDSELNIEPPFLELLTWNDE